MKTVGVNGFGRIGRYFVKMVLQQPDIQVALVNDLADVNTLAHLFKYDSVHGRFNMPFTVEGNSFLFENGKQIRFSQQRNPEDIPWADNGVEIVVESTGIFRTREAAERHLSGGAKKVIISAPSKSTDVKTVVMGINEHVLDGSETIVSNASCTTNNIAPLFLVISVCMMHHTKTCVGQGLPHSQLFRQQRVQRRRLQKYFPNTMEKSEGERCAFRYRTDHFRISQWW